MDRRRTRADAVSLAGAVAILLAGCLAPAPSYPGGPTPDGWAIQPTATPRPTDCVSSTSLPDGEPSSLQDMHDLGTDGVPGTFGAKGVAFWNTHDRERPVHAAGGPAILLTPLEVVARAPLLGKADPSHLVIVGGTLGCDSIVVGEVDRIPLTAGADYVFIVIQISGPDGRLSGFWSLLAAWPLDPAGNVTTEQDGVLSLEEVARGLADGRPEVTVPPAG